MPDANVLALDLGTSGLKAAIVSSEGALVDSEVVPLEVQLLPNGGAEQRPSDWWAAIVVASQNLLGRGKAKADSIQGIALSSQWAGTVALDKSFEPLRPALIWMDARGGDEVKRLAGGFPSIDGYGAMKVQAWIRKTGGAPSLSGKDPVGHIAWLKKHEPKTYADTAVFLEPKDWVNQKLTGRAAASFDSIVVHWVTDNRKIDAVAYDEQLLKLAGMERSKLPELIAPTETVGTLTSQAAQALGLPQSVKVISGAADMHMAAIGAGTTHDFEAHLCLGTSSWLLAHVPFKKTDLSHNMAAIPAAIPGRYLFSNEQETAAAGLKLVVENLLGLSGPGAFSEVLAAAEKAPAGCEGLTWLPWLHGERSPVDDRHVRGGFAGLSLEHGRGHLIRSVLEGVALNGRWLLQCLEANLGKQVPFVTVVGGGARSDLWCQIHADVFGRPIKQVEAPQMANSRGAAFQALVGLKLLDFKDVPARVPIRKTFTPNLKHAQLYTERFEQFLLEFKHRRAMGKKFGAKGH